MLLQRNAIFFKVIKIPLKWTLFFDIFQWYKYMILCRRAKTLLSSFNLSLFFQSNFLYTSWKWSKWSYHLKIVWKVLDISYRAENFLQNFEWAPKTPHLTLPQAFEIEQVWGLNERYKSVLKTYIIRFDFLYILSCQHWGCCHLLLENLQIKLKLKRTGPTWTTTSYSVLFCWNKEQLNTW